MFLGVDGGGGCNPGEQKQKSGEQSDPPLPRFLPSLPSSAPIVSLPSNANARHLTPLAGVPFFRVVCWARMRSCVLQAERQAKNGVGRSRRTGGRMESERRCRLASISRWSSVVTPTGQSGTLDSCWAWKALDGQQTGASVTLLHDGHTNATSCQHIFSISVVSTTTMAEHVPKMRHRWCFSQPGSLNGAVASRRHRGRLRDVCVVSV